jgi:Thiamine pyrophosphate enzyme, N-terminal TPP binding domain
MRLTGSQIFMKCLQAEGVHTVFGHPGGMILHGYDVLLEYPIRHNLVRHEQVAIHAVEGYYKASGKTGTFSHPKHRSPGDGPRVPPTSAGLRELIYEPVYDDLAWAEPA